MPMKFPRSRRTLSLSPATCGFPASIACSAATAPTLQTSNVALPGWPARVKRAQAQLCPHGEMLEAPFEER